MFCKECGKKLEDSMQFCPYCGAAKSNTLERTNTFDPENISASPPNSDSETKKAFISQNSTQRPKEIFKPTQKRKPHVMLVVGIIVLVFCMFRFFGHTKFDIEYSNNDGNKLPIVVTDIEISKADYLYLLIMSRHFM